MFDWVVYYFASAVQQLQWQVAELSYYMSWVRDTLLGFVNSIFDGLQALGSWIKDGARLIKSILGRVFGAFAHLNFSSIWKAIQRAYKRFRRALTWYELHVQAPIDRLRRTIMDLYNRFFRPILRVLDSFRVMIRILALFNRRLAAKIDGALFSLEAKLMWPITELLKRVNELSSYTRAIITSLGLLDRVLLVESLRRDASLVWEVLTNPRQQIYGPTVKPEPHPSIAQAAIDIHLYVQTGGGPTADRMDALDRAFQQAQIDLA